MKYQQNNEEEELSDFFSVIKLIFVFIIVSVAFTMLIIIPSCEDFSAYAEPPKDQPIKQIVMIQHQMLPVWRDIVFGFLTSIENKNYHITRFNADGDLNLLDKYINDITKRKPFDLIISIGSISSTKILAKEFEKPILISGLASPEYSGIIKNWNSSGRNFAGAEIRNQTYNGLSYLFDILPFTKLGYVYILEEPSHEGTLKELQALSEKKGFTLFSTGIKNRDNKNNKIPDKEMKIIIAHALARLIPHTDTFYVNLSRTFIDNYSVFNDMFIKNKILSIGDKSYLELGCVIGITSDYFKRGEELAYQTVMILEHDIKPQNIRMDIIPKFSIEYNLEAAKKIEFNPSAKFLLNTLSIQTDLQ